MTNNSSPHWDRSRPQQARPNPTGHSAPSESYAELLAALDRADVSEAVRAAFAHALNPPPMAAAAPPPPSPAGPNDHANSLVERYLSTRGDGPRQPNQPPTDAEDPRRQYTLHLTFPAGNLRAARSKAAAYAQALATLRPEVGTSPALLSRADQWNHLVPVICGRTGPAGELCTRATDHLGCHRDATANGLCWGDDDPPGDRPDDLTGPR